MVVAKLKGEKASNKKFVDLTNTKVAKTQRGIVCH
jgi:hypothetical protein